MARKSCVFVFFDYMLAHFIFFLLSFVELDIFSLRETFFFALPGTLTTSLSYSYLGE